MDDFIFKTNISINTKNTVQLKKLLELEIKRKKYKRSDSKILIDKQNILIEIFAKDIIALKATINNYISLLELIIKTYEVNI